MKQFPYVAPCLRCQQPHVRRDLRAIYCETCLREQGQLPDAIKKQRLYQRRTGSGKAIVTDETGRRV